jgi:hypothetical protein
MNKSIRQITFRFSLVGVVVATLISGWMLIGRVEMSGARAWMVMMAWPTFPLVMSAEAGGGAAGELIAFLIGIATNALVYGLVGLPIALIYRRLSAPST